MNIFDRVSATFFVNNQQGVGVFSMIPTEMMVQLADVGLNLDDTNIIGRLVADAIEHDQQAFLECLLESLAQVKKGGAVRFSFSKA